MITNIQITKIETGYQARIEFDDLTHAYKEEHSYLSLLKWLSHFIKIQIKIERKFSHDKT